VVFKRILGVFKSKEKILAPTNIIGSFIIWWINNIKPRVSDSPFYIYNLLK